MEGASAPNNFRPIAPTSVLFKTMERVLVSCLSNSVADMLDPLQFAYWSRRGTGDAVLTLVEVVTKHLMSPMSFARILFVDFCSAFNTIKTQIFLMRLIDLKENSRLIL